MVQLTFQLWKYLIYNLQRQATEQIILPFIMFVGFLSHSWTAHDIISQKSEGFNIEYLPREQAVY